VIQDFAVSLSVILSWFTLGLCVLDILVILSFRWSCRVDCGGEVCVWRMVGEGGEEDGRGRWIEVEKR
jgi:hypothetical protein